MGLRYRAKKLAKKAYRSAKNRYTGKGFNKGVMQLAKDVMWVKSQLNVEQKYVDNNLGLTNIPASGTWLLQRLNGLTQGSQTIGERDGASVRFKSFKIQGNLERQAGNHRVRMVIFVDKEPTASLIGSNPNFNELFQNVGSIDTLMNYDAIQQKRFRILYDRQFRCDGVDQVQTPFKKYIKMNMVTKWLSASGLPQNIQNNALYIAFFTDDPAGTATTVTYQSRLTYIDN